MSSTKVIFSTTASSATTSTSSGGTPKRSRRSSYTGTTHPQDVEPHGWCSGGGGPTIPEQNEAILMWRIDWD